MEITMTVINTNVGALTARTYAVKATESTEQAMERLSSGLRINSAADDAAGLAVANKMESQLRGMNMAIRNSQDGISLVQTAESAMGEINNMAIRMRELAVQMNNGVYTDSDRTNAQLEVTALLAEIDKIANNAAFNEVKILDGTYSQDIRAGNTNPEIINVSIDRMNTDSLGGANLAGTNSIATGNDSTDVNAESRSSVDVTEAALVTVKQTQLGTEIQTFASTYATDGSYSLDATAVAAGWAIDSSGNITKSNVVYDTTNSSNNSVSLEVTYSGKASASGAVQTFKDNVSITIGANDSSAVIKSATSSLTTQESNSVSFRAVDSNNAAVAEDGQLSMKMQEFVAADSYGGTWSITGTDSDDFSISSTGVVTASLNFESAADANTDNTYEFDVIYTSSTGDKFTESVSLAVTNGNEEIHTITFNSGAGGDGLATHGKGTKYEVAVDGQTITAYKDTAIGTAATAASIAEALNAANQANAKER
jgi:flagellin